MEEGLIADLTERIRGSAASREVLVKRVANALRAEIAAGKLIAGTRLINEIALAQRLEISRPTLREAVKILAREGLLNIKHGVGTFVADEHRLIWSRLDAIRSFTDLIRSVGGEPSDSHLAVTCAPAAGDIAEELGIPPRTPVAKIDRVRLIDGAPLAVAAEHVLLPRGESDFEQFRAFGGGSLYNFVRERCGIMLSRSTVTIAAVPADAARAKLLKLRRGTPLLLLRELHFDVDGRPVLLTLNWHNSSLVQFTLTRAGLAA